MEFLWIFAVGLTLVVLVNFRIDFFYLCGLYSALFVTGPIWAGLWVLSVFERVGDRPSLVALGSEWARVGWTDLAQKSSVSTHKTLNLKVDLNKRKKSR